MMAAGSFQATRTTGTVSVCEIACNIGATSLISDVPCCRSTHRASKPWRAMTSAVKPCETESQPSVGHFLARHISLILFRRMALLPFVLRFLEQADWARSSELFQHPRGHGFR